MSADNITPQYYIIQFQTSKVKGKMNIYMNISIKNTQTTIVIANSVKKRAKVSVTALTVKLKNLHKLINTCFFHLAKHDKIC